MDNEKRLAGYASIELFSIEGLNHYVFDLLGTDETSFSKNNMYWCLTTLAVLPSYRGKGLSEKLLQASIDHVQLNNDRDGKAYLKFSKLSEKGEKFLPSQILKVANKNKDILLELSCMDQELYPYLNEALLSNIDSNKIEPS